MSYHKNVTFECDRCGYTSTEPCDTDNIKLPDGWKGLEGKDICPECDKLYSAYVRTFFAYKNIGTATSNEYCCKCGWLVSQCVCGDDDGET